ncbi:MAG: hypothetical protein OEZ16_09035 [Chromatiales bacterium]|nr:hypothetical protein [Chromatiales bacterium]
MLRSALPLLLTVSITAHAAEGNLEDVLQGFDETPVEGELDNVLGGFDDLPTTKQNITITEIDKPWQLGGALTISTAYNYEHKAPATGQTDYRGLSRLRGKLNLDHDYEFSNHWRSHLGGYAWYDLAYQINGRGNYSTEVIDEYESEVELGEAWLQGKLNRQTDIKLGRQIVVWGKSDNIRITDLINPMDNREPGMVDIEDLRLPLAMARLDYYTGDWGITALAIPEIRFSKQPPIGSDFYPMPGPMPDEAIPAQTEYGLAANGTFSGWDLSLYWASLYDDTPYSVVVAGSPELQHARITMAGSAVNIAIDNWLLKGEFAHLRGLRYSPLPNERFSRSDTLLGVEYAGIRDTSLSLEVANRHLHNFDSALVGGGAQEDEWQTAVRYSGDFVHARLHLLAVLTAFGKRLDEGGFSRYSAAYDLADGLTVTGGVVTFQKGDKFPFGIYGENDRGFIEIKYSF